MLKTLVALTAAVVLLSGCHHNRSARVAPPPAPPPPGAEPSPSTVPTPATVPEANEEGLASWYGHPYHGRPSASGEIYDMEQMTAAHRTLAFNTMVRVHDLDNQQSVDVRINDRGPFVDGRIIDLSHAAARAIGMIGPGTARVRLEILNVPAAAAPARYAVQVGAFHYRDNAERLRTEMQAKYGTARLVVRPEDPGLWRVMVGAEPTEDSAGALAQRIRGDATHQIAAFVVRIDPA
jgi:rare lipoprotein A